MNKWFIGVALVVIAILIGCSIYFSLYIEKYGIYVIKTAYAKYDCSSYIIEDGIIKFNRASPLFSSYIEIHGNYSIEKVR
jgi:hypothetical protein